MSTQNHGRLQQMDSTLDDAFAAALESIRGRSREVILAARLATAVRMGREAETTTPCEYVDTNHEVSSSAAASMDDIDAALFVRRGGRP